MKPRVQKALVVCLDGVRHDVLQSSRTPALDRLTEAGFLRTSLIYAPPVAETSTGPGVATMVTGVWPGKHNVTANVFHGHRLGQSLPVSRPVTLVDIVPTVLAHLGVPADPAWALDGTVLAGLDARLAPTSRKTNSGMG